MNRLARLVVRRPIFFLPRRAPPLRRHFSLKPSPESLYAQYLDLVETKAAENEDRRALTLEEFKKELEDDEDPAEEYHEYIRWVQENRPDTLDEQPPLTFEEFKQEMEEEEESDDEGLYEDFESEGGRRYEEVKALSKPDPSNPESMRAFVAKAPFVDKYQDMLAALEEMEATDPNFPETLNKLEENVHYNMTEHGNPVFRQRLDNLNPEARSEQDVAQRVAQLILTTNDKWEWEQIEDSLATYKGPLSRLNVGVEWYLNNPHRIYVDATSEDEEDLSDSPWASGERNYDYYYEDTPFDELTAHLRKRDVQYIITDGMDYEDTMELFALLDKLIAPVFNEDMDVLHDIAAIFAKYDEDVHLQFHTEPRLPRIRRLEVFKRILPRPDDETPATQQQDTSEIEAIVAEAKQKLEIVEAEARARRQNYPNLMTRDPLLDSRDVLDIPPTKDNQFQNRVVIRNHHSIFTEALHADNFDFDDPNYEPIKSDDVEETGGERGDNLPISAAQIKRYRTYPILFRMASKQTGKGKIARIVRVTIVGDGEGMVGLGFGKHEGAEVAAVKSYRDAVRNMDWVERFENRTIWTEVQTKFGATVVILRPRPVGFGLRCNPYIHTLLAAAGIKDISAKVWGSRNPIGVLKATLRLIQAGNAPLGMGDGVGGPGRRSWKGTGLRNKNQIERERGRRLIDLRV
ncbi:hypothetical protein C8R46DRAFT_1061221 [Mycena filopes]|nr:hypothetical protein C8R46DRAFT_1061221 [Mycena filopes]